MGQTIGHNLIDNEPFQLALEGGSVENGDLSRKIFVSNNDIAPPNNIDWKRLNPGQEYPKGYFEGIVWVKCVDSTVSTDKPVLVVEHV